MAKLNRQSMYLWSVLGIAAIGLPLLAWWANGPAPATGQGPAAADEHTLETIPFDGQQAYEYLTQLCEIGPRWSGSPGMTKQQELLVEHFRKLGAQVERQEFRVRHPLDGSAVNMANLVITWHPDRKERVLLCAHYDTRPYPDRDPRNPRGVFVGANDGASGVALLMELGRHMPDLKGRMGVDFVLFDGEELVFRENDPYFYGSQWFARSHRTNPPGHRYRYGVLLDMVGDRYLRIDQEQNSLRYARAVMRDMWETARRLNVPEFSPQVGPLVNDDHLPLNEVAQIPTIDLIDFDYPSWHTEEDTPEQCSALSLAKVGWVVHEWLRGAVAN